MSSAKTSASKVDDKVEVDKIVQAAKDVNVSTKLALAKNNEDIVAAVFIPEFGESNWTAAKALIQQESGFNPYAVNKSSGACGLGQSLPCSKVLSECDNLANVACQARWIASYIKGRYGTPNAAWAYHLENNWY